MTHVCADLACGEYEEVPFNAIGGLGRAYELFGDSLSSLLDELNARLAA